MEVLIENDMMKVKFSDGSEESYPSLFLQLNCLCKKCFNPLALNPKLCKLNLVMDLDMNKRLVDAQVESGNSIRCTWSDGQHECVYTEKWLLERKFTPENIKERKKGFREDVEFIGPNHVIESQSFESTLSDPSKLLRMLRTICKQAVFLLKGAPKEIGQVTRLADKIAFIRTTRYGSEFTVRPDPKPQSFSAMGKHLCFHTDVPAYPSPPGVQILHCVKQYNADDGAYSNLVDGFRVAEQMKQEYPEQHRILAETPVEFRDIGSHFTEFNKIHHSPTFVYSKESGKLERVVFNDPELTSFLPIPVEKVGPLIAALNLFIRLCYDKKNLIRFKPEEGDMILFDNWRLLHGREAFDPSRGDRHLQGCHLDWPEVISKIRVLENQS